AERVHGPHGPAGIENTQDHRLAVEHRDDADADVDLAAADLEADAAVLGQAFFGDVEVAEDLEAGNDGCLEPPDLRRDVRLGQHAVHPVADAKPVFERLRQGVSLPPV